ncbi:MAG: hypothetical protein ACXADH_13025 [Candidatus Kariarchaeaceae archaeon]
MAEVGTIHDMGFPNSREGQLENNVNYFKSTAFSQHDVIAAMCEASGFNDCEV